MIIFESILNPSETETTAVGRTTPLTPFNTTAYAAASAASGKKICLFALRDGADTVSGCLGLLSKGRLLQRLEIPSVPMLPRAETFWEGILAFCRRQHIHRLEIQSYASVRAEIPKLPGEESREDRTEFVIDLRKRDFFSSISTNHRRSIKRGIKTGLGIRRVRDPFFCRVHLDLMQASMERRKNRGENIIFSRESQFMEALLKHGAAELFQAVHNEQCLSSIMVLRPDKVAYYLSAGTSSNGMNAGASAFLVHEIALLLKGEGVDLFNLGGATPHQEGLRRFKAGFGAGEIPLQCAHFSFEPKIRKRVRIAIQTVVGILKRGLRKE